MAHADRAGEHAEQPRCSTACRLRLAACQCCSLFRFSRWVSPSIGQLKPLESFLYWYFRRVSYHILTIRNYRTRPASREDIGFDPRRGRIHFRNGVVVVIFETLPSSSSSASSLLPSSWNRSHLNLNAMIWTRQGGESLFKSASRKLSTMQSRKRRNISCGKPCKW